MQRAYWPTEERQTITPEAAGFAPDKLALMDSIIQSQYTDLNGIIIVRNGYVVHEKYFRRKNPTSVFNVGSVIKSVLQLGTWCRLEHICL